MEKLISQLQTFAAAIPLKQIILFLPPEHFTDPTLKKESKFTCVIQISLYLLNVESVVSVQSAIMNFSIDLFSPTINLKRKQYLKNKIEHSNSKGVRLMSRVFFYQNGNDTRKRFS